MKLILIFNKILGKGTYCTVYPPNWRNVTIAIKYFNPEY